MTKTISGRARGALATMVITAVAASTVGSAPALAQCGKASWYALTSITANGERMNPSALTAAHRSLPFGSKVLVENLRNGKRVVVRINDRGPFVGGRVIDVSKGAARSLGFVGAGIAPVRLSLVKEGTTKPIRAC